MSEEQDMEKVGEIDRERAENQAVSAWLGLRKMLQNQGGTSLVDKWKDAMINSIAKPLYEKDKKAKP